VLCSPGQAGLVARTRISSRAAFLVVGALLLGACSGAGSGGQDATPDVLPGTADDGFAGARIDVTQVSCDRDGAAWRVAGTVTNPLATPASYRIYTSFVDPSGSTRALQLTEVRGVDPGEPRTFAGAADADAADLECVLRVERVAAAD
jgi:hypothetical protein